jgi:ArsR family transcriptional regulator
MPTHRPDLEDRVFRLHADLCSTLANPKRLRIINILRDQEMSAGELLAILKVPKANLSQHITILKQRGVVVARREANMIYYRLARPKILKAFDVMRDVLFEVLEEQQRVLREYRGRNR